MGWLASCTARALESTPRVSKVAVSARQRRSKPAPKPPPGNAATAASTARMHSAAEP